MPEAHSTTPSLWRLTRRTLPHVRDHARAIGLVVMLAVGGAALAALEPLVIKQLFDGWLEPVPVRSVWLWLGLLAAILLGAEALNARLDRLVWRVRLRVDYALLSAAIERLHALPLAYHRELSVGATMTRIQRGIAGTMVGFSELIVRLLPALIYLGVSLIVMIRLEWRLALTVLVLAPLPALLGARAAREQTMREHALMERWTSLYARFNEVLSGILVVKSFVMEDHEKQRFLGGVGEANQLVLSGVATDARTNATKNLLCALARLGALGWGGTLVMSHEITLGTLVAFVGYLGGVLNPVQALTGMYQTLRRASVSLESVLSILDAQDALRDRPDARVIGRPRGEVEFRDVAFGYRPGQRVLERIDLHVQPGELVALVGPSGAGKTTLMALLQRLYDPARGAILVDGYDLRELTQRSLRAQIGVVLQEGMLFSDSARDNIAFGKLGASLADVERAARAANAHEFILALPQGYDTPIGERGCKLSGGERQRIAIARALLKDAPILVLDEATSALDAENEELVQQALARLTYGRTTFVIAHRLSTITSADRIVVFRDGTISEIGSHIELMSLDGYYASLIRKQLGGLTAA